MENITINIITAIGGIGIAAAVSAQFFKRKKLFNFEKRKKEAEDLIDKSKEEAGEMVKDATKRAEEKKEKIELEIKNREERIKKIEEVLKHKEEYLNKKQKRNSEIKLKIAGYKEESSGVQETIKKIEKKYTEKLSEKTGLNTRDLKEEIINKYQSELEEEAGERLSKIEEDVKENAVKTAKTILVTAMQRLCSPTSVESKVILIHVPKDHIKGKIVGKEGKNIEEFEKNIEVDIIFNDLPETISVSGYNLVNRRIAEKAILKLIKETGEITTESVKKAIKLAGGEMEKELFEIGKNAVDKLGIKNLPKDLITTIGRLQYRTSYGQNIMKHSMEVSWIAAMLGGELGLNSAVCKIAGFLHDLGKAIDQDPNVQGAHDFLTKELMEKYGFSEEEVHAAWTHHDSAPQKTPEALIVKAADAVSAGRPGARQESIERYGERIQALEDAAKTFTGVKKSYAISAGRELRVIVNPEEISDESLIGLATEIAGKIEKEISYPGKIRVNAIRRTDYMESTR